MLRLDSVASVRRHLRWDDSTVFIVEMGGRRRRTGALLSSIYFFLLGMPAATFGLWWLVGLASDKVAFYLAAGIGAMFLAAPLTSHLQRLMGRPPSLTPDLRAFSTLWGAASMAFLLVAPGPVRAGLVVDGGGGFWGWLWFFLLQGFDLIFTGMPRGLGLQSLVITPVSWPARTCLGIFNFAVSLSLLEVAFAIWRLHVSGAILRETVRGLYERAKLALTIDLSGTDETAEQPGLELVVRGRMNELRDPSGFSASSWDPGAEPDGSTIYHWELRHRRRAVPRVLLVTLLAPGLPLLAFGAAWLLGTIRPRETLLAACGATVVVLVWRLLSVRRTLARSLLGRMAAGALSVQVPTLLALGLVGYLFFAPGFVRDGLVLPEGATALTWAHFLGFHMANAILLDLFESMGVLMPPIVATSTMALVALAVLKMVAALGLVEGLLALWRRAAGKEEVHATDAEMARAVKRLPRGLRRRLTLARLRQECPQEPPFVLDSGLLERAWEEEAAKAEGSMSPRWEMALGILIIAGAALALWFWAPDLGFDEPASAPPVADPARLQDR